MSTRGLKEALVFLVLFCGFVYFILRAWGCSPAEQRAVVETVENAAAVTQYKLLLANCRMIGKDAGSYEAYEVCANALDRELCRNSALRCEGGVP